MAAEQAAQEIAERDAARDAGRGRGGVLEEAAAARRLGLAPWAGLRRIALGGGGGAG